MQREVEAFISTSAETRSPMVIEHLEDDERDDGVVDEDDGDAGDLIEDLPGIAFDQAGGAADIARPRTRRSGSPRRRRRRRGRRSIEGVVIARRCA